MLRGLLLVCCMTLTFVVSPAGAVPEAACHGRQFQPVMQRVVAMNACWNHGDIDCVVNDYYAKHFIYVGDQLIRSKAALRRHYQLSFQKTGTTSLGHLSFNFIRCQRFASGDILTLQEYILTSKQGVSRGYDILLWQKQGKHYFIVMDFPKSVAQ